MTKIHRAFLAGSSLNRVRRGRPRRVFEVAPGRSFERVEGQYPVKPKPKQSVEKQIEVTRTKERSFTKRGERIGGIPTKVVISNADAERGVQQRKEITDMQDFLQIAFDPYLAPRTNTADFTDDQIDTALAYAGDAMDDAFSVGETVQYRKMPQWMGDRTKWRLFCEKLAVRKSTYHQNIALLVLSFRQALTNDEIFKVFWDSSDKRDFHIENNVAIVPNWPFKTIKQMERRRADLIKRGNKMFGVEQDRKRQRKPYQSLLCDQHSERNGEQVVPIKVVEYLGNNEYVLKCGCHRTIVDYTPPDKSGKRKPIRVKKEAENVEIVEPVEIFLSPTTSARYEQLSEGQPARVD